MNVGAILGWKHNHAPGICTVDGVITEWPAALGPWPTQAQIDAWTAEYDEAMAEAAAAAAVPVCTPWQIRKALNAAGLRAAVEAAVAASGDQDLKDGWQFATEFRADDPFVIAMGAAVGKSEAQTAALIAQAATL